RSFYTGELFAGHVGLKEQTGLWPRAINTITHLSSSCLGYGLCFSFFRCHIGSITSQLCSWESSKLALRALSKGCRHLSMMVTTCHHLMNKEESQWHELNMRQSKPISQLVWIAYPGRVGT